MENELSKMGGRDESLMPPLDSTKYIKPIQMSGVQPADKIKFLKAFYQSGNISKSAASCGFRPAVFQYHFKADKVFAADFAAVRDAMKNNLEEVMYNHGLKEKGYMDRITWLRRHYPEEYNPNHEHKEGEAKDVIGELASKLKDYNLVPKSKIIDAETSDGNDEAA